MWPVPEKRTKREILSRRETHNINAHGEYCAICKNDSQKRIAHEAKDFKHCQKKIQEGVV